MIKKRLIKYVSVDCVSQLSLQSTDWNPVPERVNE